MRLLSVFIIVLMILGGSANSQEKPLPVETVKEIARAALPTFGELVTSENFEAMGFKSLEEAKSVALDDAEPPLQVFTVRLDRLKEYQPGTDAAGLLTGGEMAFYPVIVAGEVRTAVGVAKVKDTWEATSLGDANLIRLLTSARRRSIESTKLTADKYFTVWVPALNLHFVAYRAEANIMLIPIQDLTEYELKAGEALPAGRVFETILPAAKAHEGSPG